MLGQTSFSETKKIPKKIRILKFVAEQGIVSVQNVKGKFDIPDSSDVARKTMSELKIAHVKYGTVKNGVWFIDRQELLESLKNYYPNLPGFSARKIKLHEVPHSLGINHIRLTFEKSSNVEISNWYSEPYLRALESYERDGLSLKKLPDAVFFRKGKNSAVKKHFLEYERTLKSKERYEDIFTTYVKREDTEKGSVLYICEHALLKSRILQMLQSIKENCERQGIRFRHDIFRFETIEEFNQIFQQTKNKEKVYADFAP